MKKEEVIVKKEEVVEKKKETVSKADHLKNDPSQRNKGAQLGS